MEVTRAINETINQTEVMTNETENITSGPNTETASTVNSVYMMILIIVGLAGNILTISVLSTKKNRKVSTAILYMSLAVSDLHIIILNLVLNWIWFTFKMYFHSLSRICHILILLQMTSVEMSAWIVAIITLERVVSVKYPFRAKTICTPRTAVAVVVFTLIIIACSNLVRVIGQDGLCVASTMDFKRYFDEYEYYKTTVVQYALPAVIIISGNVAIQRSFKRTTSIRGTSTSNERDISITRSLILVSAAFLTTMTPGFVYYNLMLNDVVLDNEDVRLFVVLLSNTNASINFILYMLQGSRFRKEVKELFSCKREMRSSVSTVPVRAPNVS